MSNIIERLRWHSEDQATGKLRLTNPDGPEAAAEIERLRAENARLLANAEKDIGYLAAYHHWCTINGCAPSSSDLIAACAAVERLYEEIDRLRAENARLREALEDHVRAAECIRHWHDTLGDEGMVVSAEHVRLLWEATSRARAALAEGEKKS